MAAPAVTKSERRERRPPTRARRKIQWHGLAMASPPVLVVLVFVGFPVVAAVLYTFGYPGGPNSVLALIAQDQHLGFPTIGAYAGVLGNASARADLAVTIIVTVLTVALVLVLSWAIALYLRLAANRTARLLSTFAVVPLFIPVVIASYAILGFYAADGFPRAVFALLGWGGFPKLSYTMVGVTIGEVWTQLPFGVLLMTSGLQSVPNSLIEAAQDAGARLPRIIRTILVPLNLVPTVIVTTFTAIYVLGSFTVPYIIGPNAPNLLGTAMTFQFMSFGRPQQAEVMAAIVFVLAAGIGTAYVWANVRSNRARG